MGWRFARIYLFTGFLISGRKSGRTPSLCRAAGKLTCFAWAQPKVRGLQKPRFPPPGFLRVSPPFCSGHHHIGIVTPATGTDEPLLPIGHVETDIVGGLCCRIGSGLSFARIAFNVMMATSGNGHPR
jgi:hypothetical protein